MVDMPKEYERCRLQLIIEYNRILAWGDAVGLVEIPEGSDISSALGTNAIELCCIFARIGGLLEEFKDLSDRWGDIQTIGAGSPTTSEEPETTNVRLGLSSLALAHDRDREKRKRLKGLDAVLARTAKGARIVKQSVRHPSRVRWVMVDQAAFEALLKDIHGLVERMQELMSDYQEKQILDNTAKIYREMVVVRNDLSELRIALAAVVDVIQTSATRTNAGASPYKDSVTTFRDLLQLKQIKRTSDELLVRIRSFPSLAIEQILTDAIRVSYYNGFDFNEIFKQEVASLTHDSRDPYRPRGFFEKEGTRREVWIEWRTADVAQKGSLEDRESLVRTATLAEMLASQKSGHLLWPTCIGYVDDRLGQSRMGWIFEMPRRSTKNTALSTLHGLLGVKNGKPTLFQRVSMAWKLAYSVLHLHTADWLHKGIHSANVVFCCEDGSCDYEMPILAGFEYSRPESNRTTSRSLDPSWDIYRWPSVQNEMPVVANSRKTYDIYSLGLLLLEIGHWEPLHKLVGLKRWPSPSAQNYRIRGWLLGEEAFPPFQLDNPLAGLRQVVGDRYWKATRRCLFAHGEKGMQVEEYSDQSLPEVGSKILGVFTELVVDELRAIDI